MRPRLCLKVKVNIKINIKQVLYGSKRALKFKF